MKLVSMLTVIWLTSGTGGEPVEVQTQSFHSQEECAEWAAYRNSPAWEDQRVRYLKDGRLVVMEKWVCLPMSNYDLDRFSEAMSKAKSGY